MTASCPRAHFAQETEAPRGPTVSGKPPSRSGPAGSVFNPLPREGCCPIFGTVGGLAEQDSQRSVPACGRTGGSHAPWPWRFPGGAVVIGRTGPAGRGAVNYTDSVCLAPSIWATKRMWSVWPLRGLRRWLSVLFPELCPGL